MSPIEGLDVVAYHRRGNTLFFILHGGGRSVEAEVDIQETRNHDGEVWYEARSAFISACRPEPASKAGRDWIG